MLGNFSFGDYFKADAIALRLGAPDRRLGSAQGPALATVFTDDDDAFALWKKVAGCATTASSASARRTTSGRWATPAPCGPCSEIHFHQGDHAVRRRAAGRRASGRRATATAGSRSGTSSSCSSTATPRQLTPLPKPSIDTGMGLERIAAVVQGVHSNFDTDLLRAAHRRTSSAAPARRTAAATRERDVSMRVIADHARAATFLIADGVMPSNEWRGYVLRRIMRRAMRHGRMLGLDRALPVGRASTVVD